jgi:putative peptidoglycan lipid II flippase
MKKNIIKASFVVAAATLLLRIVGFFREVTLASTYGAGIVSDAFVIAMIVPSVFFALFGVAIGTIYIPQYVNVGADREHFTNNLLTFVLLVALAFAIIFSIFPQLLVHMLATKIAPETFILATDLMRIMVWSAIPVLLAGIFRAYLQIKNFFFIAISSDIMINIFIIISIVCGKMTNHLIFMGFGVTVGNFVSLAILVIFCWRKDLRYRPLLDLKDPHLLEMFRLTLPVLITTAVLEINQIVDKNLAATLVIGTVSSLNYAAKINNVVSATIGMSVSIALFPKISEMAADGDKMALKKDVVNCIKNLMPLLLPLTVGVVLLAEPLIRILLERGEFMPEATRRTAECLQMYALAMIAANLNPLLTKAFYAMRQAKLPAVFSSISVAAGIMLNFIFIGPLKHRGLALASSISLWVSVALLGVALRKHTGPLDFRSFAGELGKAVIASGMMGIFVWIVSKRLALLTKTYWGCFVWTGAIVLAAILLYGLAMVIMRSKWSEDIIRRINSVISKH